MPFWCPKCSSYSIEITDTLQFAPDNRSDEICLQGLHCGRCGFSALGVYEESRRGRLDAASWEHTGYRLAGDELAVILTAVRTCPTPNDPLCHCAAHLLLGRKSFGRWVGLRGFETLDSFPMQRER